MRMIVHVPPRPPIPFDIRPRWDRPLYGPFALELELKYQAVEEWHRHVDSLRAQGYLVVIDP